MARSPVCPETFTLALRILALTATGVFASTNLTGCNAQVESLPGAISLRDPLVHFLFDTSHHTNANPWRAWTYPQPRPCADKAEPHASSWRYVLLAPQGENPKIDAQEVAEHWRSLGVHVQIVDSRDFPTVYASGGQVQSASFETDAGDREYRIGASSWCGDGNTTRLIQDEKIQRDAGKALFGDELYLGTPPPTRPSAGD